MKVLLALTLTLLLLGAGALLWAQHDYTAPGPLAQTETVIISPGTGLEAIARQLAERGVVRHKLLFMAQAVLRGQHARFKAGEYAFPPAISPQDVTVMMAEGQVVGHYLTVPEGLMTSEVLELVRQVPELEGEITLDVKEGELLPETYQFTRGDKRNELVARMRSAMQAELEKNWKNKAEGLPLADMGQALTLASIVEKETGVGDERARVAAVYVNRLRIGMKLQADPTTAYALTRGKAKLGRMLTTNDLQFKSPYNTYYAEGLPPGPIANPGKAAIAATLHPDKTEELFFVADGKGGHNFARTDQEHAANVRLYRAAQRAAREQPKEGVIQGTAP